MLERLRYIFRFPKKEKRVISYRDYGIWGEQKGDLRDSYVINSVFSLFASAANNIDFTVYKPAADGGSMVEDIIKSKLADYGLPVAFAEWYVYGVTNLTENFECSEDGIITVERKTFFKKNKQFAVTVLEFERMIKDILQNSTSLHFITFPAQVLATAESIEQVREMLRQKRRDAQAGGIEVVATEFDIKSLGSVIEQYKLDTVYQTVMNLVSVFYGIPLEILDNSRATYNNRQMAMIDFYHNTIIPSLRLFLNLIEFEFAKLGQSISIIPSISNLPISADNTKQKLEIIEKMLQLEKQYGLDLSDKVEAIRGSL